MQIDGDRLWASLEEVNAYGARESGGVERLAWTEDEIAARRWLMGRCADAGLEVSEDQAGNVWALGRSRPSVVLGSHLDTVPDGGRFDGALGVVTALEVVRAANEAGEAGADRLGLVCFTDEEGVRFGIGMTGSRAVAGTLGEDELREARADDGTPYWQAVAQAGVDPGRFRDASDRRPGIAAYLELHVEQGRRLERAGSPVGVVTAIVGLVDWKVEVMGEPNHAGTTLPADRRDALVPVAAMTLAAHHAMGDDVVATVGDAAVIDGASNVVPGRARATLDVRSTDTERIETTVREALGAAREAADRTGCTVSAEETKRLLPAEMAPAVREALGDAASAEGLEAPELASMAGHDGMSLTRAGVPCGMLFVRSRDGVSHSPAEHSEREDCLAGARVIGRAALTLAQAL